MSYLDRQIETVAWLFKTCSGSFINLHVNNLVGPSLSSQIGNSHCKRMTLLCYRNIAVSPLTPPPGCSVVNRNTSHCCLPVTWMAEDFTRKNKAAFSLIIYNPTTNSILIWLKGRQIKLKLKKPFQKAHRRMQRLMPHIKQAELSCFCSFSLQVYTAYHSKRKGVAWLWQQEACMVMFVYDHESSVLSSSLTSLLSLFAILEEINHDRSANLVKLFWALVVFALPDEVQHVVSLKACKWIILEADTSLKTNTVYSSCLNRYREECNRQINIFCSVFTL